MAKIASKLSKVSPKMAKIIHIWSKRRQVQETQKGRGFSLEIQYTMVGDVYRYMYQRIRVYLLVHLAAIASIDRYSNSDLGDALQAAPKPALT